MTKAKRNEPKQISAQDSIPFQRMFPDGICRAVDGTYSKTIRFSDLNYMLSTNEDKSAIFDGWCEFLNYFDSSIKFQLSFINRTANADSTESSIVIPLQGDEFDSIRAEYSEMLQNQRSKGNTRLTKTKYLTFSIEAESLKSAKLRIERIETDILGSFKRLGVAAEVLNGYDRLETLHGIFHINEQLPFRFSWDWLAPSGLSVKDFIAPSSFEFKNGKYFGMGGALGAA